MAIKRTRILSKKEREIIAKAKEDDADADYGTTTEMITKMPIHCLIVFLIMTTFYPIFMFLGWILACLRNLL